MPIDIDEEELQRILDQGSAYGPADDAEAFRRTLGPGDFEGDMPKGTRVSIEPEVSVPPRRVIQPRAAVPEAPAEKVVQVPGSPADDFELAAAKQEDRMARSREAFERGTRQLIGGLTQTKALDSTPGPVDAVAQLYSRRKAKDDTHAKAEAGRLGAAKLNYDTKEDARKAALDQTRDARDFEYRQKHDAAMLAQQADSADANRALTGAGLGIRAAQEKRDAEKEARGKDLPATEIASLSELPVAEKQVDAVVEAFSRLGMGGAGGKMAAGVTKALDLQGTDAAEYQAAVSLAQQAAGKIVEGGKLAAGDEAKYRNMMPRGGDSPEVVKQKAEGMKVFLRDLARRRGKAFREARYNVPDSLIPADEARPTAVGPDGQKVQLSADGKSWEPIK